MRVRAFVVLVSAVVLLSGCGAATPSEQTAPPTDIPLVLPSLIPSDVDPDTAPGFLEEPIDPDHPLPPSVAEAYGVDPGIVRYQGEFEGEAVYLYLVQPHDVAMLTFEVDDPGMGGGGMTAGNSPTGLSVGEPGGDRWMLQYVPQGTADLPDGWTALSPWVAWRDL